MKGFPGGSADKESACNARDLGLIPGLGRSLGKATTPVFCRGEFHGLYCPWGHKESDMTENFHFHFQVSHENSLKILKSPTSLNLILQRKVRLTQ